MKPFLFPAVALYATVLFFSACAQPAESPGAAGPTMTPPRDDATTALPGTAERAASSPAASATYFITGTVCDGGVTPAATEGPYYKGGSPQTGVLLDQGTPGSKLNLTGYVFDPDCQPVANAWLDFWQADASGAYGNTGFDLRGHQYTDASGRYSLVTVVPGEYSGRTPHIHAKVQAPGGPVLTTQLYLPNEPDNARDSIFNRATVMRLADGPDGKIGSFDFVVRTGP